MTKPKFPKLPDNNEGGDFWRSHRFAVNLLCGHYVRVPPKLRQEVGIMVGMTAFRKMGMTPSEWRAFVARESERAEAE